MITRNAAVDGILYVFKRLFNFALWQMPIIRIFWIKNSKYIRDSYFEHLRIVNERDKLLSADMDESVYSKDLNSFSMSQVSKDGS